MGASIAEVSWLEEPLAIELSIEELLTDLDQGWSGWDPTPEEARA